MKKRTTNDLIQEMLTLAKDRHWKSLCIIVACDDGGAETVFHDDPNALALLSRHVRDGGAPLGIIGFEMLGIGKGIETVIRPFKEFTGEELAEVREKLTELARVALEKAKDSYKPSDN